MNRSSMLESYLSLINHQVKDVQSLERLMISFSSLREKVRRQINCIYLSININGDNKLEVNQDEKELLSLNKYLERKIIKKILNSDYIEDTSTYFQKFILDLKNQHQDQDQEQVNINKIKKNKHMYLEILGKIKYTSNNKDTDYKILEDNLYKSSRDTRYSSWKIVNLERNKYVYILEDLFSELVFNRNNLAKMKGHQNYKEYVFSSVEKSYYLRKLILEFSSSHIVPLKINIETKLLEYLDYETLKPWDVKTYEKFLPSHSLSEEGLIDVVREVLRSLDKDIYLFYNNLIDKKLYDIVAKKHKAKVNYCTIVGEEPRPYIYLNLNNTLRDIISLVHEFGHAYHYHQASNNKLLHYSNIQLEIAEIASLTMEALFIENLKIDNGINYSSGFAYSLRKFYYTDVLYTITGSSMLEEFEQYVYTFGTDNANEKFNDLMKKYNGIINMTSYYKEMQHQWRFSKQLFLEPFYIMEYGVSQIIALLILIKYKKDSKTTLGKLKETLSHGSNITINVFLEKMNIQINDKNLREVYELLETELEL